MVYNVTIGDGSQALDIQTLLKYVEANAVLSGLDVTIDSGDFGQSDTLAVASGDVLVDGTEHSVSATGAQIDSASSDPRKDVVYVDGNGNVQVEQGQEAEALPVDEETGTTAIREHSYSPAPPDLADTTGVPLAEIWVNPDNSSLQSADIRDRRPPAKIPTDVLETIAESDLDFDAITQGELDAHIDDENAHHAEDHGSRHHQGGPDELTLTDLDEGDADPDEFLRWDGSDLIWSTAGGTPTVEYASAYNPHVLRRELRTLDVGGGVADISFGDDGSVMLVADGSDILQYILSSPYDADTGTLDATETLNSRGDTAAFGDGGEKLYTTDSLEPEIYEYDLSTAWDITTASLANTASVANGNGLAIKPDGTEIYDSATQGPVTQYTLSTAWDTSTMSETGTASPGRASDLAFNPDGDLLSLGDDSDEQVEVYELSTPWDITTISQIATEGVSGFSGGGVAFDDTGSLAYLGLGSTVSQNLIGYARPIRD